MFKFKFDTTELKASEFLEGIDAKFKAAVGAMVGQASQHAKQLASQKLGPSGLGHWNKGFKVHQVSDDLYIISVDGQLANWMEDGIKPGEISKKIMEGEQAKRNQAQGKHYVDVPLAKSADQAGNIASGKSGSGPKVNIAAFKDADSMVKSINASDWKNKSQNQKRVIQSRVQDIIKNVEPKTGKTSYMTIRRVTEKSQWPKTPFEGAKVLDDLGDYINQNIEGILERFL